MSDFDPNASARWGQGATRAGRAEIDQGLRSYMLGVYNNMVVGLALTGAVALGVHMLAVTTDPALGVPAGRHLLLTSFGVTLYTTPLKWVVMLAPLAFVFFFSFRINQISASSARGVASASVDAFGRSGPVGAWGRGAAMTRIVRHRVSGRAVVRRTPPDRPWPEGPGGQRDRRRATM
jgi:hypothetical protein